MALNILEIVQGSLSLIYIAITLVLSGIFIIKYFKLAKPEFFFVGLALVGMASPWFPEALGFLIMVLTNSMLSDQFYLNSVIIIFIIFTSYLPIAVMSWLTTITKLLNLKTRKFILIIFLLISIVFEITFFTFASIDLTLIGTFVDPFNSMESIFVAIFYVGILITILVTGFVFSFVSMRSENPIIKLKGKIILMGFLLFLIGALLPYFVSDIISLIITRIIVLFSSISMYLGFILPKPILKLFKIENQAK